MNSMMMSLSKSRGPRRTSSCRNRRSRVALSIACLAVASCAEEAVEFAPKIPSLRVFEVGERATGQSRRISGSLAPLAQSPLSFGVGGKIERLAVVDGQVVAEDQLIASLESNVLDLAVTEATSAVTEARAVLVDAESAFNRARRLLEKGGGSKQDFDAATAALARANAAVDTSTAALDRAQLDQRKAQLVAPFAGRIVSVEPDEFQEVGASETIAVIQSDEALKIEVLVPESMIGDITFGQLVQVQAPTTGEILFPATVSKVAAQTSEGNAYPVTAVLSGTTDELRPGMTASVTFTFSDYLDGQEAFLLPLTALAIDALPREPIEREDTAPIFVLDESAGVVNSRTVRVGGLRGNAIEVFEGLAPGDLVVSAGVAFVRDGMQAKKWAPRQ